MVKLHTSTYAITGEQWLHLAIISISATLWYYPVSFCHTMVLSSFFLPHYGIILFLSATLWYYPVSFSHTMVLSCFFRPHYGIILFLSATLWYYPVSFSHTMVLSCFFLPHYGIILFLSATLWYYPVSFSHTMVLSCFFLPHYGIILLLALQVTCTLFSLQTTTKKGQSETHVRGIKRTTAWSFSIMDDEVWSPCASKQP